VADVLPGRVRPLGGGRRGRPSAALRIRLMTLAGSCSSLGGSPSVRWMPGPE
jgi:hypothetical protein